MKNIMKLVLLWLLVAVPLGWGVAKSVQKTLPLFSGGTNASPVAPK